MLSLSSRWVKPFEYVDREGIVSNSIVAFGRRGYEQKTVQTFTGIPGHHSTYISKYRYILWVDLWIVKLKFNWIGRERKNPHA